MFWLKPHSYLMPHPMISNPVFQTNNHQHTVPFYLNPGLSGEVQKLFPTPLSPQMCAGNGHCTQPRSGGAGVFWRWRYPLPHLQDTWIIPLRREGIYPGIYQYRVVCHISNHKCSFFLGVYNAHAFVHTMRHFTHMIRVCWREIYTYKYMYIWNDCALDLIYWFDSK